MVDKFNTGGKTRTINKKRCIGSIFVIISLLSLLFITAVITTLFSNNLPLNLAFASFKPLKSHDVQLQGGIHLRNLSNITSRNAGSDLQIDRPGTPFDFQTLQNIKLRAEFTKMISTTPTLTQELRVLSPVPSLPVPFELPFETQNSTSNEANSNNNIFNAPSSAIKAPTTRTATTTTTTTTTTTSTASSIGFNGLSEGQFGGSYYPPDVQVAVGSNYIIEMNNLEGKVFTKAGGSVYTFSLYPFFIIGSSDQISHPRIMYDAASGRWFASIADLTQNMVKVAVSTSSIPNAFKIFGFKFSNCPDYPTIGLNDDKFAISVNLFTASCTGSYSGVQYYIINKSFMTGATTTPIYSRSSPDTSIFSLQPIQSLSSTPTLYMVTVGDDLSNHATVYSFSSPPSFSNPPTSIVNYAIGTSHIPPDAVQPGTTNQIDTHDARVLDAAWYQGRLWLTFNDACTPSGDVQTRSCVRLIQINTPTSSLSQDFDVGAKGAYYFYPALRMDSSSNLLVVFGASSLSIYPSIFATGQDAAGGPLDSTPLSLKIGTYPETTNRFGEYFGAAVDPSNPSIVWGAGEYHSSSPWSSFIAMMFRKNNVDPFGIKELYPTKASGEQWYINMQNPTSDPQFNPNGVTLTKNTDGSYKTTSTSVRLQVYTSSGYHQDLITTYDQQILAQKGYMQSPNDWKNVEMTGYLKVNSFTTSTTNGAAHIELLARGGTHSSSVPCEGTAYHSNTYETGRVKFEKELEHTSGYTTNDPQISGATGTLQGKWVGIKAVFYTFQNGTVELQQWLDDKSPNTSTLGNNWHMVLEFKDKGQWGGGIDNCDGTPTTIITWGGPIAHFRWDNIDNMDVKDLSVREIQPPQLGG